MRRLRGFVTVGGLLLLGAMLSNESWAYCAIARLFNSANSNGYSYVYTPGVAPGPETTSVSGEMEGAFWILGHGVPGSGYDGIDNGRFEALVPYAPGVLGYYYYGWMRNGGAYLGPDNYPIYINSTWIASSDIDGCPDTVQGQRCMAILLSDEIDGTGYFALLTDEADQGANYDFVQPANGSINLIEIPPPEILGNVYHNSGADFGLLIGGPDRADLADGLYLDPACLGLGDVVGYRIYSFSQASGSPPPITRDRALWTAESGTMELGTTFTLPVDCSAGAPGEFDIYLALGLVFDSDFQLHVSRNSTRVACGPTIAQPDDLELKPRRKPRSKTKQ